MPESENSPNPDLQFATLGDPKLRGMLEASERFCRDLYANKKPRWLSILGRAGTGKTHLAKGINRYFQNHLAGRITPNQDPETSQWRMRGGMVSWRQLGNDLRADFMLARDIKEDWFVALDDIGAEYRSKSDFLVAKLDEILDARLGKWTVLTANLSLEEIGQHLDVRIASRMLRGNSVVLDVGDLPDWNLRRL